MSQFVSSTKGDVLVEKAAKKLTNATGFVCRAFGQTESTKEDAAELYIKAAAQYKLSKCYEKAAKAYTKAAEIQMSADSMLEAKQSWKECARCYAHFDYKQAIAANYNAIEIALDSNRMREASKLQHAIAKMLFENDDVEASMTCYQKAAEFYEMEHDTHLKNKMLLMVAQIHAAQKNWETAAKLYEDIAKDAVDDKLLRWTVKEKLFNAALLRICSICEDESIKRVAKWQKMDAMNEEHCDLSDIYASGRESKLIGNIIECLKQNDLIEFKELIANYDKICKIEKLQIDLMYSLLRFMKDAEQNEVIERIWLGDDMDDEEEDHNDNLIEKQQPNPFQNELTENDLKSAPDLEMDV